MWLKSVLPLAMALALLACNARDRRMPDLSDADATADVVMTLSPWEDGSPDRSSDGRTMGDYEGDRQTFIRWVMRWATYEGMHEHERDYKPFDVPSTISGAIAQQHAFEREQRGRAAAAEAKNAADEAEIEADANANRETATREQAAYDAQVAAAEVEQQRQDAAEQAQQVAAQQEQDKRDLAAADQAKQQQEAQSKVNEECRRRRQEAGNAWLRGGPGAPPGTYAQVWASFHCRED